MPGIITTDDSFTDLALNAQLAGRLPTVHSGSTTWAVDPNATAITGGGDGDVKFTTASFSVAKISSGLYDNAVVIDLAATHTDETYWLFLRDTINPPNQRFGYSARFQPRATAGYGLITAFVVNDYTSTPIAACTNVQWPFVAGVNTIGFEAIGSNFRVVVNNAVASSFVDSTRPFVNGAHKVGFGCNNPATGQGRVKRFTVYDSIVIAEAPSYPVVFFG